MTVAERATSQLFTIGEVSRALRLSGSGRSPSWLRRMEELGVVTPLRAKGLGLRLYTPADVEALKAAIRGGGDTPLDAA